MTNPLIPGSINTPHRFEPRRLVDFTWHTRPLMLKPIAASKFIGYSILSPPASAVSVSKALGYSVLGAPANSVNISKMVGYAVITEAPITSQRFERDYKNPLIPRRLPDYSWIETAFPGQIPLYPQPPFSGAMSDIRRPSRLVDYTALESFPPLYSNDIPPGQSILFNQRATRPFDYTISGGRVIQDVLLPPGAILLSDIQRPKRLQDYSWYHQLYDMSQKPVFDNTSLPARFNRSLNRIVYEQQHIPWNIYFIGPTGWLFTT
jgi:hypothetical protein